MVSDLSKIGLGFLTLGALMVIVISFNFPKLPLSTCTALGYGGVGEPPSGFELLGVHLGWISYSPDQGLNQCETPVVHLAIGLFFVGTTIFSIDNWEH